MSRFPTIPATARISAGLIIDPKFDPIGIPEVELGQISLQGRLANVLINAINPAFDDRKVALDGVDVFLVSVGGYPMVGVRAIGVSVLDDDGAQICCGYIRNVEAANAVTTLNQGENRLLWGGWLESAAG